LADVYEPWERLVKIVVLGRVLEVPENNILLRQLQFVSEDVGMGRYCWNAECRYCEVQYQRPGDPAEHTGLACRIKGTDGMRLVKVSPEIKWNMSDALLRAPRETPPEPAPGPATALAAEPAPKEAAPEPEAPILWDRE
jgi:hypothetical protein